MKRGIVLSGLLFLFLVTVLSTTAYAQSGLVDEFRFSEKSETHGTYKNFIKSETHEKHKNINHEPHEKHEQKQKTVTLALHSLCFVRVFRAFRG